MAGPPGRGVSVGAPPDALNGKGQDWSLPPFVPWKLREAGYTPFVQSIRASLAGAGGLRIDHVMGLFRLWWIPAGHGPTDGGYVRYPADDLLDILALESCRANALIIGEDLGVVEAGVREELARRRMLAYRLLWFAESDPAQWPELSMGAVTTHDLPTVAGLWTGADRDEQRRYGVDPSDAAVEAMRGRLGSLPPDASPDAATAAAYRRLAEAPSTLIVATLEDAVGEHSRPNLPGWPSGPTGRWRCRCRSTTSRTRRDPLKSPASFPPVATCFPLTTQLVLDSERTPALSEGPMTPIASFPPSRSGPRRAA